MPVCLICTASPVEVQGNATVNATATANANTVF
jgi:hypothetical protein